MNKNLYLSYILHQCGGAGTIDTLPDELLIDILLTTPPLVIAQMSTIWRRIHTLIPRVIVAFKKTLVQHPIKYPEMLPDELPLLYLSFLHFSQNYRKQMIKPETGYYYVNNIKTNSTLIKDISVIEESELILTANGIVYSYYNKKNVNYTREIDFLTDKNITNVDTNKKYTNSYNEYISCALSITGELYQWDVHVKHSYGLRNNIPQQINVPVKFMSMSVGVGHVLALTFDGDVYSWGSNSHGQCGTNGMGVLDINHLDNSDGIILPIKLQFHRAVQVSAGDCYSLVLMADYKIFGFGSYGCGELGIPIVHQKSPINLPTPQQLAQYTLHMKKTFYTDTPIQIPNPWKVIETDSHPVYISAGCDTSAIITQPGGKVWICGRNGASYLYIPTYVPYFTQNNISIKYVTTKDRYLAVSTHGELFQWGEEFHSSADFNTIHKVENSINVIKAISNYDDIITVTATF